MRLQWSCSRAADARGLRSSGNVATTSSSNGTNTGTIRQLNAAVTSTRAPQAVGSWRYQKRGCHYPGCWASSKSERP
jgi:hypothetical protein